MKKPKGGTPALSFITNKGLERMPALAWGQGGVEWM